MTTQKDELRTTCRNNTFAHVEVDTLLHGLGDSLQVFLRLRIP